jgi:hypothetical protein
LTSGEWTGEQKHHTMRAVTKEKRKNEKLIKKRKLLLLSVEHFLDLFDKATV